VGPPLFRRYQLVTANLLVPRVQLGLARSGWAAILLSPVWLGAVVACGMTDRMTTGASDEARVRGVWASPKGLVPDLDHEVALRQVKLGAQVVQGWRQHLAGDRPSHNPRSAVIARR
jgi:hypothetical protein